MEIAEFTSDKTVVELFGGDRAAFVKLFAGIAAVVELSFKEGQPHAMKTPTKKEVSRRIERCFHWARILRADLKWGVDRLVASLPDMLNCELSGMSWTPGDRMSWMPGDGN